MGVTRVVRRKKKSRGYKIKARPSIKRMMRIPSGRGISAIRSAARTFGIPRTVNPFPFKRLAKHKYVEFITVPAGAVGSTDNYAFATSSLYDPNYTGAGHQPMFRDEMALLYKHYCVIASYIKITLDQMTSQQEYYGIVVSQDTTFAANPETHIEQYGYRRSQLNAAKPTPVILRASFDAKRKFVTTLKGLLGDTDQHTPVGGSPGSKQSFYFNFWRAPHNQLVGVASQRIMVEINYICMWLHPQDAVGS